MDALSGKEIQLKQADWLEDKEYQEILKPFAYITQTPGKDVRAKYCEFFNYWFQVPNDILYQIVDLILHLHPATLLLDDIQDNSVLRRGKPAAHKIYGVPRTLNTANLMQWVLLDKGLAFSDSRAAHICLDTVIECLKGQGLELYWRDNFICPTEDEYMLMVTRKTGGPLKMALQLLQLYSKNNVDVLEIGRLYGIFFQISDDYQNLINEKYFEAKGFCEDITEGKFSFPVVHAVNNYPEDGKLIMDILKERTKDVELLKQCLAILEKCGSLEYTKQKLKNLSKVITDECSKLPGYNPHFETFLVAAVSVHT